MQIYYVSLDGNDEWNGLRPEETKTAGEGPFRSLERARTAIAENEKRGREPIRVEIRDGVYELSRPLKLDPGDSGSAAPTDGWNRVSGAEPSITWAAYAGEHPIISGGRRIDGWQEDTVDGERVWQTRLDEVASGDWYFTQLWVNGRRALRPRLPKSGLFTIEEPLGEVIREGAVHAQLFTGQDAFRYRTGDLVEFSNIGDVEFVGLHYWIESRINFAGIDESTRTARLTRKSRMRLTDDFESEGAPYYVENVREAFDEPGTWYLDRPGGVLTYRPLPGEQIEHAVVVAPVLDRILEIDGASADTEIPGWVEHLVFDGLTFSHSEWTPGPEALRATSQAACHVGGAVRVSGARDVRFTGCRFEHLGSYGIEISGESRDIDVVKCRITDLGGGGVKVWHSFGEGEVVPGAGEDWNHTGSCSRVRIVDCVISDGGYRFHQAVGVLIGMCSGVQVLHNEICRFDYTGVSVGWTWGYQESHAYGNLIEYNHIHHVGRGTLSDMGGIYTLGVQPGTRLTHNLIHDVQSRGYGGWGIYNDEGSSYLLVENNVVYNTKSNGYNQHYGRENIVRNNVFAFGGEAQVSRTRPEGHISFRFEHNIVYFDSDGTVLAGTWDDLDAVIDSNLYWNRSGNPLDFAGSSFQAWRRRGADRNSVIADPQFRDPDNGDFVPIAQEVLRQIGFRPFDLATVGPRS